MGENATLTRIADSDIKIVNDSTLKEKSPLKKPLKITDTTLRDAHQSLLATRMTTKEMLPACEKLDAVGFYSMEVWGGATFDSCMRFLDEDPWERLRILKKNLPNTKLQMLLRGQNILGYKHYSDDVVTEFVKRAVVNGIDIIRIFDALNDVRNMETAFKVAKSEGAHVQGTICFTISPFHNNELFVKKALEMERMGADSICIKDMAGLISPYEAYDLTKDIKEVISIPLQLHCHFTSGMGMMAYLKATEAGIDMVDTAISSLALQTSQPALEPLVETLRGTPYNTGLDLKLAYEIASYFKKVRENHKDMESNVPGIDTRVLTYQIPGGMLANLAENMEDILSYILFPEVARDFLKKKFAKKHFLGMEILNGNNSYDEEGYGV